MTIPATELKPPTRVKLFYSLGQMAQSGGFDTAIGFVFFYYTFVLGLSGALVGAALAISLAFDAVVDPLIGSWSDNIRSRFGRRLPLMMISIPPIAITLGLLFSPPAGLSQILLFVWLTVASVAVRSFISLFNVPYIALGAELADGYAERSSVVAYRAIAGIFASVVVTALAFTVFFAGPGGLKNAHSYPGFGWSVAMMLVILLAICCAGVARYAATLPQAASVAASMLRRLPSEVAEFFRNPSFRVLFLSAVVFYVAVGANATLATHVQIFVWRLRPQTMQLIGYAYLAGILVGVPLAPLLQRRMEKKAVVLIGLWMAIATWIVLPLLWAGGVFRPSGDGALTPLMLSAAFGGVGIGFTAIAYPSMMADAADEHEHLFNHRREGLYFAGLGFAAKAASGLGVLVGGLALDLMGFPHDAGQHANLIMPEPILARLILAWGPGCAVIGAIALATFLPYAITRRRHDELTTELRAKHAREAESLTLEAAIG